MTVFNGTSFVKDADSNGPLPDETTKLLQKDTGATEPFPSFSDEAHDLEDADLPKWKLIRRELAILLKASIPVSLAYMLQNSIQAVSVLIVGQASPHYLAAAAFSYMFASATAWLIATGGSTALDTIASATFTGSKNPQDLGVLLQRAFVVLGVFYIPVAILWAFSEHLFLALGQDPEISEDSAKFLTVLIPGGLGFIYFECMKKFLQNQGIMRAGTYVLLLTAPISALLNYLFVYTFGIGFLGAPIATGISYWLSFFLLVLYARFFRGWKCWGGWTKTCLKNIPNFAKLALLGVIHIGTEWWAFEIIALAAGRLGKTSLATQSVIMTADQLMAMIPMGLGVTTSSRVGNLLGARNARGAARAANTSASLGVVMGLIMLTILMASRNHFAKIFTPDEAVIELTSKVMPAVALFQIADFLNCSCGGSLRGMGRQHIGATVNIVCYYFIALPVGIWLAFHGWGLPGLWFGNCGGLYLVGLSEWLIVAKSNYQKQVKKAFERMDQDERAEAGVTAP